MADVVRYMSVRSEPETATAHGRARTVPGGSGIRTVLPGPTS
jgi:hypothetical protein